MPRLGTHTQGNAVVGVLTQHPHHECDWEWSVSHCYPSLETLSVKSQLSEINYGSNSRAAKGLLLFSRVLMFLGSPCVNCPNTLTGLATLRMTPPGKLILPRCLPALPAHVHSRFLASSKLFPLARGLLFISKTPPKYHRLQAALLLHLLPSFCPSFIKPLLCPGIALELPSSPSGQHLPRGRSSHLHLPRCFPSLLWSLHAGWCAPCPSPQDFCTGCVSLLPGMLLPAHVPAVPHLGYSFLAPWSCLTLSSFRSRT